MFLKEWHNEFEFATNLWIFLWLDTKNVLSKTTTLTAESLSKLKLKELSAIVNSLQVLLCSNNNSLNLQSNCTCRIVIRA